MRPWGETGEVRALRMRLRGARCCGRLRPPSAAAVAVRPRWSRTSRRPAPAAPVGREGRRLARAAGDRSARRRRRSRRPRGAPAAAAAAESAIPRAASMRALRAASASTLRIASSSASRSLRDVGFRQRRLDRAQLRDQRGARPLVKRPAGLAGALAEPLDGAGNERLIVGHGLSLRSSSRHFHLLMLSNGFCIRMVSSRSGLVDSSAAEQPISSSMRRTYLMAWAGSSAQERARAVFSCQPAMVS